MKKIIYTLNGSLCVVHPIINTVGDEGMTEDQALARAMAKDIPVGATDVHVVNPEDIPTDRTFRDAWKVVGGKIETDIGAAREIQRSRGALGVDSARTIEELKAIVPV